MLDQMENETAFLLRCIFIFALALFALLIVVEIENQFPLLQQNAYLCVLYQFVCFIVTTNK